MAEKIAPEQRAQFFKTRASEIISRYNIRRERTSDLMGCVRIGYLFSVELTKIYAAPIGSDAHICIRDWAWDQRLHCDVIREQEYDGEKKIDSPFWNGSQRVYSELSFSKYTKILTELLLPPRHPLTRRTPVTTLE